MSIFFFFSEQNVNVNVNAAAAAAASLASHGERIKIDEEVKGGGGEK